MRYRIQHITEYSYADRVSHCYNLANLIPRTTSRQQCIKSDVQVNPATSVSAIREDYFGNTVYHFEILRPHKKLIFTATSEVETSPQLEQPQLDLSITCGEAQAMLASSTDPNVLFAREFLLDTPMVKASNVLREYAAPLFEKNRSFLSAVEELTHKIYEEFTYCPESTTVATPLSEVLEKKRGVCQDFAHLQIACLRSLGFPAKYVSGYIETLPLPGQEKLVGTDASHAWISVYSPREGWLEFDPTNNCLAHEQHIVTAWGRDYFDVTPLKGIIFGGGEDPQMTVSVDVARL